MATVRLRAPLSELAGASAVEVDGPTVALVLGALERDRPALAGWILDERGAIRRHVNVFVDGSLATAETAVGAGSRVHVLPAITGGRR